MKRQDLRYKGYSLDLRDHRPTYSFGTPLAPKPEPWYVVKLLTKRLLTVIAIVAIIDLVSTYWSNL